MERWQGYNSKMLFSGTSWNVDACKVSHQINCCAQRATEAMHGQQCGKHIHTSQKKGFKEGAFVPGWLY